MQLKDNKGFSAFNLGNGSGFSVLDVINSCQKVSGSTIDYSVCGRRLGDPPSLIANSALAIKLLGWKPEYVGLNQLVGSAWRWHKNHNLN